MKSLAQFITNSRTKASIVALLGSLVPLLAPATVGLVTLSQGIGEAALIVLWASILPLVTIDLSKVGSDLILAVTLATLIITLISGWALKNNYSWTLALLAAIVISSLFALTAGLFSDLDLLTQTLNKNLKQLFIEQPIREIRVQEVISFIPYIISVQVLLSLLVARWWQSQLYNPGGLSKEIHTLRLEKQLCWLLLALILFTTFAIKSYQGWVNLLLLPLLLSGCGFIHWWLHRIGKASAPLFVIFYLMLLILEPVRLLVVTIALMDSQLNLRNRF